MSSYQDVQGGVKQDLAEVLRSSTVNAVFDHVAIAAPRLRDLLPLWMGVLGGKFEFGADHPIGWRALRLSYSGHTRIELMEPLAGSTFFDSHFARTGGGGPHHVTWMVEDLAAARTAVESNGFEIFGYHDASPEWKEFFVHPRSSFGVLVQLAQQADKPGRQMTLEDVLGGHGYSGTGVPSP